MKGLEHIRDRAGPGALGEVHQHSPLWLALLFLACALALTWQVGVPSDIWWQLAHGKLIAESGRPVAHDTFTFTICGPAYSGTYLDKYWMFEWVAYELFHFWHWAGLQALLTLLVTACFALSAWSLRREPAWFLYLMAVPALILLDLRCSLRPHWLSYAILPPFLRLAQESLGAGAAVRGRNLLALWLLQVAWTNLHSEFPWGVLISVVMAAEGVARALRQREGRAAAVAGRGVGVVGVVLACLVNPFGLRLPLGILSEFRRVGVRPVSTEWLPFWNFAQPLSWASWIILAALVAGAAWCARRERRAAPLILFGLFAVFSLRSIRFLGPMVLTGLWAGMEYMSVARERCRASTRAQAAAYGLAALAMIGLFWAICTNRLYVWQRELKRFGSGWITSELPADCSDYLRANELSGHFLNDWSYGGFLIWHNGPAVLVAEDGRTAPFPPELSGRLAAAFEGDAEALTQLDATYRLDGAVVPWNSGRLLRLLAGQDDWALLFMGSHSSVWMKRDSLQAQGRTHLALVPPQRGGLEQASLRRFVVLDERTARDEEPWLNFATFLYRRAFVFFWIGRADLAREEMAALASAAPEHVLLERLRKLMPADAGR